jgi:hypothetical protein
MSRTLPVEVARRNRVVDPDGVFRGSLAIVALLGGCDLVFGLERPVQDTVCGSFGDEQEVPFGDELTDITDFSFNGPGTRGFVRATIDIEGGSRTGPVPVLFDNDQWRYDATFEANWRILESNDRVRVARMARDNELYVAQQFIGPPSSLHVFHYVFVGANWVLAENMEIAFTSNTDAVPGGELSELVAGSDPPLTFDFLPIFRFDQATEARSVAIATHAPGAQMWQDQERIGGLASTDTINEQHQPWSGALARTPDGRQVLVYAATPDGSSENSDLFIAEKHSGGFVEGVPLTNFNTGDEELEPWVSEDCSMITFRRTARGSPFDGESRSGGTIYMSTIK